MNTYTLHKLDGCVLPFKYFFMRTKQKKYMTVTPAIDWDIATSEMLQPLTSC